MIGTLMLLALSLGGGTGASEYHPWPDVPTQSQSVELHVGLVPKGDPLLWWARLTNCSSEAIRVSQVVPSDGSGITKTKMPLTIEAGTFRTIELPSVNTRWFNGPISRSVTLVCEPRCAFTIELFEGKPES